MVHFSDFEQGGYNKYEHNFSERSNEQLQERLAMLAEHQQWHVGERRTQVEHEMSKIAFELAERLRVAKNEQIEQAWGQHG